MEMSTTTRQAATDKAYQALAAKVDQAIAAATGPTDRFGDRKVYIEAVRNAYHRLHGGWLTDDQLAELNRRRHITLVRADHVRAMDPTQLAASRIEHGASTFHFAIDPAAD